MWLMPLWRRSAPAASGYFLCEKSIQYLPNTRMISETEPRSSDPKKQAVVGGVKHPSLCPLVKHIVDALRDKGLVFGVEQRLEIVPQQIAEIPNHIVGPEDAVNDDGGIRRARRFILLANTCCNSAMCANRMSFSCESGTTTSPPARPRLGDDAVVTAPSLAG